MIDLTKPVQTRDGRKVRVLCTDGPEEFPVAGYVARAKRPTVWTRGGHYNLNLREAEIDLINVPEKRVVWVNMYPSKIAQPHTSKINADQRADHDREARIRVEYEVGQFDEEPEEGR